MGGIHGSERRMASQLHFSLEKRVPDVRLCCAVSCPHVVMRYFILFYFIYGIYVANAFRTSVYGTLCELPTMGSYPYAS